MVDRVGRCSVSITKYVIRFPSLVLAYRLGVQLNFSRVPPFQASHFTLSLSIMKYDISVRGVCPGSLLVPACLGFCLSKHRFPYVIC